MVAQQSNRSDRLLCTHCRAEEFRRSFIPAAKDCTMNLANVHLIVLIAVLFCFVLNYWAIPDLEDILPFKMKLLNLTPFSDYRVKKYMIYLVSLKKTVAQITVTGLQVAGLQICTNTSFLSACQASCLAHNCLSVCLSKFPLSCGGSRAYTGSALTQLLPPPPNHPPLPPRKV